MPYAAIRVFRRPPLCATIRFEVWDQMWDLGMAGLTERGVQTAKPGRHSDGDGLHLVVSETGRKKWVLRYQVWRP